MRTITLEELLEAGCHFGHQVTRQNPKSRDFVFEARDNIHIIDLEKTKEGLESAGAFIKELAQKPDSTLLILGTKRQAGLIIKEEVKRAAEAGVHSLYNVTARWMGGTLTNTVEIAKNYHKLKDITKRLNDDFEKTKYTKREISLWEKERQKLLMYYDGTKDMDKAPDALFIIDTHLENLAVREAVAMGVPTVGIVDTNADPDAITYPIPANDDAAGSIQLITTYIIDAWIEGKKSLAKSVEQSAESEKEKKTEKTAEAKKTEEPVKKEKTEKKKEEKTEKKPTKKEKK